MSKDKFSNNTSISNSPAYLSFNDDNKQKVLGDYAKHFDKFERVQTQTRQGEKTTAIEVVRDTSVRPPFSRFDYEYFRPYETIPKIFPQLVRSCRTAYQRIGIIRNVFDMMTDFAIEGMKLCHVDKEIETFYRVWARKVNLTDAVDEFVRHLLVDGNVVVKRVTGTLSKPAEEQWKEEALAKPDHRIKKKPKIHEAQEIPIRYIFLNVAALQFVGGDPARLAGERNLVFQLSSKIASMILQPNGLREQQIVEQLPNDIKEAVKQNNTSHLIPLDMSKIFICHHKKDSWDDWAPPFIGAVLTDIYFRDKLRLAETAALDGIINVIRLWKIGDHKAGVLPSDVAIQKLVNILQNNSGGGAVDLIWDTMIEMEPFYPPIDKILNSEKYDQVNRDILIGLGVPEVLIGGKGGNFSNSWIQLKTLVEKLQYVRSKVNDWLTEEMMIVAKTMGYEFPARVKFNDLSLQDENTVRKLIVGLLDRGIISAEAVLDAYGQDFFFEVDKIKNEQAIFKKNNIEVKSPYDQKEQADGTTPSGGRPFKQKDSSKRDERTPKVKTKGSTESILFALDAIDMIDSTIVPKYMENLNVTNARKLTSDQKDEINKARSVALSYIEKGDNLSDIENILDSNRKPNKKIISKIDDNIQKFIEDNGNLPNIEQRKRIEALSWNEIIYSDS